jgi:hypothetical protein
MNWMLIVAIVLILAVVGFVKLAQKRKSEPSDYPYQKIETLFSPAERSFFGVLNQVVGEDVRILGKVRVADAVAPQRGLSRSAWQRAFNRISAKHFDFLLCKRDDLSVICAIELDDSSHQSKKRQLRDEFLEGVCNATSIPLIQMAVQSGYALDDIRKLLSPYLENKESHKQEKTESTQNKPAMADKLCPKCSSPMVTRTARKGTHAGKKFWACSAYPNCKHIEVVNS